MIKSFRDKYRFLSNFYPTPVYWQDMIWPTSEHAYQAAKTNNFDEKAAVLNCETAAQAKRMGRRLTMRDDWDAVKLGVMRGIVYAKFLQNSDLMQKLLDTGDVEIVEGNYWGDTFWGQCPIGVGENNLGKILMEIRDNAKSS